LGDVQWGHLMTHVKYDNLGAYLRQTHPMMDRSRRMSGHPSGVIKRGRWEIPDKWRLQWENQWKSSINGEFSIATFEFTGGYIKLGGFDCYTFFLVHLLGFRWIYPTRHGQTF